MEAVKPPLQLFLLLLLLSYTTIPISSLTNETSSPSPSSSPSKSSSSPLPSPTKVPSPSSSPLPSPPKVPSPSSPSTSSSSSSTLDPKQLTALQSINIPTSKDPCLQPSPNNATLCDSSKPFRHLLALRLSNCSDDVQISFTALKSLSTLQSLSFFKCPIAPIRLPSELASNLRSFSCISSLHRLTGVWLSHLHNLTDLTVSDVPITASGASIIISNMKKIRSVTISHTNLTGFIPKKWHPNITHIDLSKNMIKGRIPSSLAELPNLKLLNLSSNQLSGLIPDSIGDLISLQNLSFSSNSMSGPIPDSIAAIPSLVHLDLSSNQFNGTVPKFLSEMKGMKYLNLENNNFQGVIPFNGSSIKMFVVFKVSGNSNLCYNRSIVSSKLKIGIAPCDKDGFPILPPPDKSSSSSYDSSYGGGGGGGSGSDDSGDGEDSQESIVIMDRARLFWEWPLGFLPLSFLSFSSFFSQSGANEMQDFLIRFERERCENWSWVSYDFVWN